MLYTFFDKLRTKPKVVREQYALLGAVCFTLMIGGVWSLSIPARLGSVAANASTTNVASAPLSGFVAQLKSQFKSARTGVTGPFATTTATPSAASSAVAALGLQLTPENKQILETPSSTIRFGTTTIAPAVKPAVVATTTATTTHRKSATSSSF